MQDETEVQGRAAAVVASKMHGWIRPVVQIGFLVFSLLIGLQFHRFVQWLSDPAGQGPVRPASVDAWLPISNLMSLTWLVRSGQPTQVHPAGLVIFSLVLVLTFLLGRGFCSWVCPIGTVSEWAHGIGRRLFGRHLLVPRWLDIPLRLLKYLLLGFFLYAIVQMPYDALRGFLEGPYNRIADVKMYLLFAEMTRLTFIVLAVLAVFSLLIRNFWCRYLCPYGALLGFFAWVSPLSVRRDAARCTGCRRCERACPNSVRIVSRQRVRSLECTTCFSCTEKCPTPGALSVSWPRRRMSGAVYAAILLGAFILVPKAAQSIGYWESSTSSRMYAALHAFVHQIDHPRSPKGLAREQADDQSPACPHSGATGAGVRHGE